MENTYRTEDANVRDVVNTAVALHLRTVKRSMVAEILAELEPKIEKARLQGQSVDVSKMAQQVMKRVFSVHQAV